MQNECIPAKWKAEKNIGFLRLQNHMLVNHTLWNDVTSFFPLSSKNKLRISSVPFVVSSDVFHLCESDPMGPTNPNPAASVSCPRQSVDSSVSLPSFLTALLPRCLMDNHWLGNRVWNDCSLNFVPLCLIVCRIALLRFSGKTQQRRGGGLARRWVDGC